MSALSPAEFSTIIIARNAVGYLTAAGAVVLLYDHLLLFSEEVKVIWSASWNLWKVLFLFNRYSIPLYIIIGMNVARGIAFGGLTDNSCKIWFSSVGLLQLSSLAVANTFVMQRVYALWDYNKSVLYAMITAFTVVYVVDIVLVILVIINDIQNHIRLSPWTNPATVMCILTERPRFSLPALALPVIFDIFLVALTIWNAFDRPRGSQTTVMKQLYRDGVVYFCFATTLRLLNIIILAKVNIAYYQLAVSFFLAMIGVIINRILLMASNEAYEIQAEEIRLGLPPGSNGTDQSQRATPFEFRYPYDYGTQETHTGARARFPASRNRKTMSSTRPIIGGLVPLDDLKGRCLS